VRVVALALALALLGCGASPQVTVANAAATAAVGAASVVGARFEAELEVCRKLQEPMRLPCIDATEARYEPVWNALEAYAAANDAAAPAIESGSPPDAAALLDAYCALVPVLADVGVEVADLGVCP